MGALEFDTSEFDDPAPAPAGNAARARSPNPSLKNDAKPSDGVDREPTRSTHPKKRKLPFRANVVLHGARYKGRRVSRGDAALDVETLGLLPGDDAEARPGLSEDGDSGGEGSEGFDADRSDLVDDEDDDMGAGSDSAPGEEHDEGQSHADRLKAEERSVAVRLAQVEKKELARALTVRKQKETYDAVVDLRIRIEPLMSLARHFPTRERRGACDAWSSETDLEDVTKEADSALASLCSKADEVWKSSWPCENRDESDANFENWRDAILDLWGRKVSEASGAIPKGGFKTLDTTVTAQMKASLATGKHLERTRRVKETISLIGGDLEMPQGSNNLHYDDGEFYRTLLREIIESGDGTGGGLRYAQLSKGGKVKKKADRSFAKGRRLKYDVHEKLVGFLAPVPLPDPGPLDEIVAGLFGGRGSLASFA